jgi:hypothetical protein
MLSNASLLSIIAGLGLIALLRSAVQAISLYRHSPICMIGRRRALIEDWRRAVGRGQICARDKISNNLGENSAF